VNCAVGLKVKRKKNNFIEKLTDLCTHLFPEFQNNNMNVDATRFRPNLVISGLTPYSEDNWRSLQIGNAHFTVSSLKYHDYFS
jgi:MOSC domain